MYSDLIDYSNQRSAHHKSFFSNIAIQSTLLSAFPGYKSILKKQVYVYSFVCFRQKYLIELLIQYKGMVIPIHLDLETKIIDGVEKPNEFSYSTAFQIKDGFYNSNMVPTIYLEDQEYNHDWHVEFFGLKEMLFFDRFFEKFYNAGKQSIHFKQKVYDKVKPEPDCDYRKVFFDVTSYYLNEDNGHFINMYTNQQNDKKPPEKFYMNVKSMNHNYSADNTFSAFMECFNSEFDFVSEFFRKMLLHREAVVEELIPSFDNYIDLFNYVDSNIENIRAVKKMMEI